MHFNLCDLAADIAQNGAESGANLLVLEIRETVGHAGGQAEFRFIVRDNGKGMSAAALEKAMDPFVTDGVKHPGRKVGLGIPFLIQTAEQSGGGWRISAAKEDCEPALRFGGAHVTGNSADAGIGTTVEAWFDLANVDTPPVGDIPGLFRTAL
ncbi:MAG: ATP-binding protein, partial [Treponema sp.]|nr:ATP-binding protein [Treponema sp.]